jgi:tannase/feruloyl esterase
MGDLGAKESFSRPIRFRGRPARGLGGNMERYFGGTGISARGLLLAAALSLPRPASAVTVACNVGAISAVAPAGTTIVTAIAIAAVPGPPAIAAFCDITGFVTTTSPGPNNVNFELALPKPPAYNGRFLFLGNGGFAGSIQEPPVQGVQFGFATVATDTGHQSALPDGFKSLDGSWGLGNLAKQTDFAFRGVHVTAITAQSLTNSFYGTTVLHRYFDGCSTGGRQAMVEAQKFPTDFDGILAGDPAIGDSIAGFNWNDQALFKTVHSWIPPEKMALLNAAVVESCDTADGVDDGLIQDPRKCSFNPASLKCPTSDPSPDADPLCLSADQVAAVKAIYNGPITSKGVHLYPGFTKSDPGGDDGWPLWITGVNTPTIPPPIDGEPWGAPPGSLAVAPLQFSFQDQFMKYFVFNSATFDSLSFDINNATDLSTLDTVVTRDGANGLNANLKPFKMVGGKLLMYHGWSDPAVTPKETVKYYNQVIAKFGGDLHKVRKFARLFMVPGMHHCGGGPGPNVFDAVTPLVIWVETGAAPDSIIAAHFFNNDTSTFIDRTMPLCAWPETAHFLGGNKFEASSWKCGP